jgi:hypothetical protein
MKRDDAILRSITGRTTIRRVKGNHSAVRCSRPQQRCEDNHEKADVRHLLPKEHPTTLFDNSSVHTQQEAINAPTESFQTPFYSYVQDCEIS